MEETQIEDLPAFVLAGPDELIQIDWKFARKVCNKLSDWLDVPEHWVGQSVSSYLGTIAFAKPAISDEIQFKEHTNQGEGMPHLDPINDYITNAVKEIQGAADRTDVPTQSDELRDTIVDQFKRFVEIVRMTP